MHDHAVSDWAKRLQEAGAVRNVLDYVHEQHEIVMLAACRWSFQPKLETLGRSCLCECMGIRGDLIADEARVIVMATPELTKDLASAAADFAHRSDGKAMGADHSLYMRSLPGGVSGVPVRIRVQIASVEVSVAKVGKLC